jgi:hypothetical protein
LLFSISISFQPERSGIWRHAKKRNKKKQSNPESTQDGSQTRRENVCASTFLFALDLPYFDRPSLWKITSDLLHQSLFIFIPYIHGGTVT